MFITDALKTRHINQLNAALTRVPEHHKATYPVSEQAIRQALSGFSGQLVFKGDPDYEKDRKARLGKDADTPKRIRYAKLTR